LLLKDRQMKKVISFTIFILVLFLVSTPSFAQENVGSGSAQTQVDYTLPYPGLLPDSPFYFLRATRDKIISLLISDPLKKAEFDLLQADKRLAAGMYLRDKKKYEMAATSISKGENYFESAITQAKIAKNKGQSVGDIASRLYKSAQKHEEVIKDLESRTKGNLKATFLAEEKRADDFEKRAKEFLPQK